MSEKQKAAAIPFKVQNHQKNVRAAMRTAFSKMSPVTPLIAVDLGKLTHGFNCGG